MLPFRAMGVAWMALAGALAFCGGECGVAVANGRACASYFRGAYFGFA